MSTTIAAVAICCLQGCALKIQISTGTQVTLPAREPMLGSLRRKNNTKRHHSLGGGDGDGTAAAGEVEGMTAGDAMGLGEGLGAVTRLFSSCTMRASHSLKGPLLAADSLRAVPRFEATRSASTSALRNRMPGDTAAVSARAVKSSISLTSRCGCCGVYSRQKKRSVTGGSHAGKLTDCWIQRPGIA